MLPMNMMNAVVAFQMDDRRPPLPPVEQMVGDAEARIAKREERLVKIEAAVTAVLEQRSAESLAALKDIISDIIADDPNGAVCPQLENARISVVDIGKIYDGLLKAVELSNVQLGQKTQQHNALQSSLQQLQYTLTRGNMSQVRGFLQECAGKGASYAANH